MSRLRYVDKHVNVLKQCRICLVWKNEKENFHFRKDNNTFRSECILCKRLHKNKYDSSRRNENNQKQKIRYEKDKQKILIQQKKYANLHSEERKKYYLSWQQRKLISDPAFKLKKNASRQVSKTIAKSGASKNNLSILKHVSWNPEQLKAHIENLWEPWMNWNNYGPAKLGEKRWNIDHIIPQAALPYVSMTDENFKKCWSLENLRPLEAIANIIKKDKI